MSSNKEIHSVQNSGEIHEENIESPVKSNDESSINDDTSELINRIEKDVTLDENSNGNFEESKDDFGSSSTAYDNETLGLDDDIIDEDALRELENEMSENDKQMAKEKAEEKKNEGNELFKKQEYRKSIDCYTNALKICPLSYPNERAILYANRAAAKIKLEFKQSAIDDCSKAIELNPHYLRAILRRAKLFEETEKLDESLEDYKKVIELDSKNTEAHEALSRLPQLINERNEKLKTEMLGKLKNLGNMILKPFGLSTENFQMQQDPNTGSYSINFTQNPQNNV